jgi:hypothetical protein
MDINELMETFSSNTKATNNFNKGRVEFEIMLDHIRKSENLTDEEKEARIAELNLRRETMLAKEQETFEKNQKRIKRVVIGIIITICVAGILLLVLK